MTAIIYSRDNPEDIETVETGLFRWRPGKRSGETRSWQAVRIAFEDDQWHALLNGQAVGGSPKSLAKEIPWLLWHAPFHRITPDEYLRLIEAHRTGNAETHLRQASVR